MHVSNVIIGNEGILDGLLCLGRSLLTDRRAHN